MTKENWIKEIKEALINRFLTEEAKARYDELDWAKDITFDVQDFIEENIRFLTDLFDKYFVIRDDNKKYHSFTDGVSGYSRIYVDLKEELQKELSKE